MNAHVVTKKLRPAAHALVNVWDVVLTPLRSRPGHEGFASLDRLNDCLLADIGLTREPVNGDPARDATAMERVRRAARQARFD